MGFGVKGLGLDGDLAPLGVLTLSESVLYASTSHPLNGGDKRSSLTYFTKCKRIKKTCGCHVLEMEWA